MFSKHCFESEVFASDSQQSFEETYSTTTVCYMYVHLTCEVKQDVSKIAVRRFEFRSTNFSS